MKKIKLTRDLILEIETGAIDLGGDSISVSLKNKKDVESTVFVYIEKCPICGNFKLYSTRVADNEQRICSTCSQYLKVFAEKGSKQKEKKQTSKKNKERKPRTPCTRLNFAKVRGQSSDSIVIDNLVELHNMVADKHQFSVERLEFYIKCAIERVDYDTVAERAGVKRGSVLRECVALRTRGILDQNIDGKLQASSAVKYHIIGD